MIQLQRAEESDLQWIFIDLEADFEENGKPDDHVWHQRKSITTSVELCKLYLIEDDNDMCGFILYDEPTRDEIVLIWVHRDQRLQGNGREAVERHCEHIIRRGGLVDFIKPRKDDNVFWQKCGYKDDESGYLRLDLLDTPIETMMLTGNLLENKPEIDALLRKSSLFDDIKSDAKGQIMLNKRMAYLIMKGRRVWKLYNVTLRDVTVLRGLLAEVGINVEYKNIQF